MTAADPTVTPARERAAALLDAPGASPAAGRAAFLRKLADEGFLPPEPLTVAANVVAGTALPLTGYGIEFEAELGAAEVTAFAAAYWSLPPAERLLRWVDLCAGCRHDPATFARRQVLEPGLDVAATPHPNPLAEEVAAAIRELFVLSPRERAVRRASWLAERTDRVRDLADAFRRLRADAPALAALDPDLAQRLAASVPLAAVPAYEPPEQPEAVWQEAVAAARGPSAGQESSYRTASEGSGVNWTVVAVVCSMLVGFLRAISSSNSPQPIKYSQPTAPTFTVPRFTVPTFTMPSRTSPITPELQELLRKQTPIVPGAWPDPLYRPPTALTFPTPPGGRPLTQPIPTQR